MSRRLYRSEEDKMLVGVCSGIAKYVQADPVLIRLAFVVLVIAEFYVGLVIYAVAAMVMPVKGKGGAQEDPVQVEVEVEVVQHPHPEGGDSSRRTLALILIGLGAVLMLYRLVPRIPFFTGYFAYLKLSMWPLALIILGLLFLAKRQP